MSADRTVLASCLIVALAAALIAVGAPLPERLKLRDGPLGMKFARLPKGTFYMGWDGEKKGKKTEIKDDFEIAIHTVTQAQWQAVMGDNPSFYSRDGRGQELIKDIAEVDLQQFPVETISWGDCGKFIKKLNEKEAGRGYLYRLPTEAEWEYACRGGASSEEECSFQFYFDKPTNDLSSEQANFNGDFPFGKAPKGRSLSRPAKVGSYKPNKLGLYDMHGNVLEWCSDEYEKGGGDRVIRGGCWNYHGSSCRAAVRIRGTPTAQLIFLGFRVVRVPSGGK